MSERFPAPANDNAPKQARMEVVGASKPILDLNHPDQTISALKNAEENLRDLVRGEILDQDEIVLLETGVHHLRAFQREVEQLKHAIEKGRLPWEEKVQDLSKRIEETLRTLPTRESLEAARWRA